MPLIRQDKWDRFQREQADQMERNNRMLAQRARRKKEKESKVQIHVPSSKPINPTGLCFCGCGQTTNIVTHDKPKFGLRAGDHMRFVQGHYHNLLRKSDPNHGHTMERARLREERRAALVKGILSSDGSVSLDEIRRERAPEFKLNACSVMVNSARQWGMIYENGRHVFIPDVPRIIVRRASVARPRYERCDIPYERDTELPMLDKLRHYTSLDKSVYDDGGERYDLVPSAALTPLELLLLKEDIESEEWQERKRRIADWERWTEKRSPCFRPEFLNVSAFTDPQHV